MSFTVSQIAQKVNGEVIGDGNITLTRFSPVDKAQAGDLTFAENEEFFAKAEESNASAILVPGKVTSTKKTLIRVENARIAYARVLPLFFPEPQYASGIHPTAVVAASAKIDSSAHIGPHCIVGEGVQIGARVVLLGLDSIGDGVSIDEDTRIFPNVSIYPHSTIGKRVRLHSGVVIGADGFGYVLDEGVHRKIPQIGTVVIKDDVELGANTTVDRGALGPTVIGKGTKIDNLVQVGHNVKMGENCIIISQVGIAGSTEIGNYVVIAGQAGIVGHIKVGNQAVIGGQSGVINNVHDGGRYLGSPAVPEHLAKRQYIAMMQLPELFRRVKDLEKRVKNTEK